LAIEKYIAIAALGLFVMFSAEIFTVYYFMLQPTDERNIVIEPEPKIYQFISIGVGPALILTGVSFIMAKRRGSKQIGIIIISGGIILLVGMAYSYVLAGGLAENYKVPVVLLVPPLFMAVSIPVILIGIRLLKNKKIKQKKDYF
jgi:hypothetical protein